MASVSERLLQLKANLALDGGVQQALPGVVDGELELGRPVTLPMQHVAVQDGDGALRFDFDEEVEHVSPSPRRMASIRCEGMVFTGSLYS